MTTIAYDANIGVVAADSRETGWHGEKYNCKKLYRVSNHVIATAGGSYASMIFVNWFDSWEDGLPDWDDHPDLINLDCDEDFECLLIKPDKTCYCVNRLFVPLDQAGNKFITLGSGGGVAQGALRSGKTPKEAIAIAAQVDSFTGGKIVEMSV